MNEPLSLYVLHPLAQFGERLVPTEQTARLAFAAGRFVLVPGLLPEAVELAASDDGRIHFFAGRGRRLEVTHGDFAGASSRTVAERLLSAVNEVERGEVVRYGGEEFAILLPGRALDEARAIAESLRAKIEAEPFIYRARGDETISATVTISFGAVSSATEASGLDASILLRAAEDRCWDAKRAGRNRVAG